MLAESQDDDVQMRKEFVELFQIGKVFESREALKQTIHEFGKRFNVVFSIANSHPSRGEFRYICKHGGLKREKGPKKDAYEECIETIDCTEGTETVTGKTGKATKKKTYKRELQKHECPAVINVFNLKVKNICNEHNHPLPKSSTTYAIFRKQTPEIMERIYGILSSGAKDPVTVAMSVCRSLPQFFH